MNRPLMFDALSDGILVVSRLGELRYANAAARALKPWTPGVRLEPEPLLHMVDQLAAGKVLPPQRLECNIAGRPGVRASLFEAAKGGDFFIVLSLAESRAALLPQSSAADPRLAHFMRLLRAELGPALTKFDRANPGSAKFDLAATQNLGRRLSRLGALAEAHLVHPPVDQERIDPAVLAREALAMVAETAARRGIRLGCEGFEGLAPLYGSGHWLRLALGEYLDNALAHSASGSIVVMSARAQGEHLRISVRNHGQGIPARLRQALARGVPPPSGAEYAPAPSPGIGLALCARVLELHGGRAKIESDEQSYTDFVIELPTGAPAQSEAAAGIESAQAQRYARDLAQLIRRRRRSNADSSELVIAQAQRYAKDLSRLMKKQRRTSAVSTVSNVAKVSTEAERSSA